MPTISDVEIISSTEVKVTIDGLEQNKPYTLHLTRAKDSSGNFIDPTHNSVSFQYAYTKDILIIPQDYEFGSLIELYLCGLPTEDVYPTVTLKIDNKVVATFSDVHGNLEKRLFRYRKYFYQHHERVTIDQIKVEYTNDVLGGPNVECLYGWDLDAGSTALKTYHYETPDHFARVTLTGTQGDPSTYNGLIQDTAIAMADRAISVTADMKAAVGTQGRIEFWTTNGVPALIEAENLNGTGEWESISLPEITLTGALQFSPQIRLITNSPDAAGSYVDWKNIYANQELILNANFATTILPWYLNSGTNVTATLKTDEAETYVRCTLNGASPTPDLNHYNSIVQHIGSIGVNTGDQFYTTLKYRAPVGTTVRVSLFALPWGSDVIASTADFAGTGEWEEIPVKDLSDPLSPSGMNPLVVTDEQQDLEIRLLIVTPDQAGARCDWKAVSVTKSLITNSVFVDRSVYVDKVVLDGLSYETEADDVYSTGTWTTGDGATPSPGYKQSEVLTNNGHFDYSSVDDAALIAGADARIDALRKGNGSITLVTSTGAPIAGATISVQQTNHEFLFGGNFFHWPIGLYSTDPAAIKWGAHSTPLTAAEQQLSDDYRARWLDLFNFATIPFYWVSHETLENQTDDTFKAEWAQWCLDNNVKTKGHTLFWAMDEPDWLAAKTTAEAKTAILREVSRTILAQASTITHWDVINESSFEYYTDYLTTVAPKTMEVWQDEGHIAFLNEIMTLARANADPSTELMINDYDVSTAYFEMLQQINSANYDSIGIQSHFHEEVWSNQKIWHVCNRFGSLKPVHLSELSVLSGYPLDANGDRVTDIYFQTVAEWPTTTGGEARQAAEVVRFYKMAFSNPYVAGITWWDITDYDTWMGAPRGLIRADMTPKPAFFALKDLIKGEWWTTESLTSNAGGNASFRGFAGEYTITVTVDGTIVKIEDVVLTTAGNSWTITI